MASFIASGATLTLPCSLSRLLAATFLLALGSTVNARQRLRTLTERRTRYPPSNPVTPLGESRWTCWATFTSPASMAIRC